MKTALGILFALVATSAQALTAADTSCRFDRGTGQLVAPGKAPAGSPVVFVERAGEGVASWFLLEGPEQNEVVVRMVLQVCRSGDELSVMMPRQGNEQTRATLFNEWQAMLFGTAPFTLRQVQDRMTRLGGEVRRSRNTLGSCACDIVEAWQ